MDSFPMALSTETDLHSNNSTTHSDARTHVQPDDQDRLALLRRARAKLTWSSRVGTQADVSPETDFADHEVSIRRDVITQYDSAIQSNTVGPFDQLEAQLRRAREKLNFSAHLGTPTDAHASDFLANVQPETHPQHWQNNEKPCQQPDNAGTGAIESYVQPQQQLADQLRQARARLSRWSCVHQNSEASAAHPSSKAGEAEVENKARASTESPHQEPTKIQQDATAEVYHHGDDMEIESESGSPWSVHEDEKAPSSHSSETLKDFTAAHSDQTTESHLNFTIDVGKSFLVGTDLLKMPDNDLGKVETNSPICYDEMDVEPVWTVSESEEKWTKAEVKKVCQNKTLTGNGLGTCDSDMDFRRYNPTNMISRSERISALKKTNAPVDKMDIESDKLNTQSTNPCSSTERRTVHLNQSATSDHSGFSFSPIPLVCLSDTSPERAKVEGPAAEKNVGFSSSRIPPELAAVASLLASLPILPKPVPPPRVAAAAAPQPVPPPVVTLPCVPTPVPPPLPAVPTPVPAPHTTNAVDQDTSFRGFSFSSILPMLSATPLPVPAPTISKSAKPLPVPAPTISKSAKPLPVPAPVTSKSTKPTPGPREGSKFMNPTPDPSREGSKSTKSTPGPREGSKFTNPTPGPSREGSKSTKPTLGPREGSNSTKPTPGPREGSNSTKPTPGPREGSNSTKPTPGPREGSNSTKATPGPSREGSKSSNPSASSPAPPPPDPPEVLEAAQSDGAASSSQQLDLLFSLIPPPPPVSAADGAFDVDDVDFPFTWLPPPRPADADAGHLDFSFTRLPPPTLACAQADAEAAYLDSAAGQAVASGCVDFSFTRFPPPRVPPPRVPPPRVPPPAVRPNWFQGRPSVPSSSRTLLPTPGGANVRPPLLPTPPSGQGRTPFRSGKTRWGDFAPEAAAAAAAAAAPVVAQSSSKAHPEGSRHGDKRDFKPRVDRQKMRNQSDSDSDSSIGAYDCAMHQSDEEMETEDTFHKTSAVVPKPAMRPKTLLADPVVEVQPQSSEKLSQEPSKVQLESHESKDKTKTAKPLSKKAVNSVTNTQSDIVKPTPVTLPHQKQAKVHHEASHDAAHKEKRGKTYLCCECGHRFSERFHLEAHLYDHLAEVTGKHPYRCSKCPGRVFQDMKLHLHHHMMGLECDVCGEAFHAAISLAEHRMRVHMRKKAHSCSICKKKYATASDLAHHQKKRHSKTKPYRCKKCGKGFHHKDSLATHMRNHLDEQLSVTSDQQNTSIEKDKDKDKDQDGEKENGTKRHFAESKPHSSSHGKEDFASKDQLNELSKSAHESDQDKLISSDFCEETSMKPEDIKIHGDKPYKCEECGENFSQKQEFKDHSKKHTHKCDLCGYISSSSSSLLKHMKNHHKDDVAECEQCEKWFLKKDELVNHIETEHGMGHVKKMPEQTESAAEADEV